MIGMHFGPFLALLIIGVIAAVVMHWVIRYRKLTGFDSFMGKWILGWIGGWLGSPVFGHWGPHTSSVYIIPALLGAFSGAFLLTLSVRASMAVTSEKIRQASATSQPQLEMRKVS
jgi:uncharacterized membrane protein YeaQ/YmgE (transglycosylase-associated protein family)